MKLGGVKIYVCGHTVKPQNYKQGSFMPYSLQIIILCAVLRHSHSPFARWAEQYTIALLFCTTTDSMKARPQLGLLGGNAISIITITLPVTFTTLCYMLFLAHVKVPLHKPVKSGWDIQPVPFPPTSNPTSSQKILELEWQWNNDITVPSVHIQFTKKIA